MAAPYLPGLATPSEPTVNPGQAVSMTMFRIWPEPAMVLPSFCESSFTTYSVVTPPDSIWQVPRAICSSELVSVGTLGML